MRIFSILCLLILMYTNAEAQNLVGNGSFEQFTPCPTSFSQIGNCAGWRMYTNGSSDYFNACGNATTGVPQNFAGWQNAAQGVGYAGFYTFSNFSASIYKEYVARQIPPLQIGSTYEVSISVSLANNASYGTDDIGVLFYDTLPYTQAITTVLPYTPQVSYSSYGPITDTQNWVRLTKTFVADSAYDNIIIGGFKTWGAGLDTDFVKSGTLMSYYYIDSVVIRITDTLKFNYNDTMLCLGDTITVPYTVSGNIFTSNNVFTLQLSNASGSFASPTTIATLASTTSGTLKGAVPSSVTGGAGYRIRIVSSNPALVFGPNDKNISIGLADPVKPVAGSNSPVCGGSDLLLTATTTTTGVTWKWTGPMSFTSTQQNPVLSNFGAANAGYYIVTAYNFGCSTSDTELVNYATPIGVFSNSGGPVCAGTNSLLFSNGAPPGTTYSWTGPNSYTSNQQNPVLTATTTAMSGDYIVVANLSSCSDTDTVSVVIKPVPVATAATSGPACVGGTITLIGGSDVSGSSFLWSGPNSFSTNQQSPVLSPVIPIQTGTYTLVASAQGCSSLPVSASVTVYPNPPTPVASANTIVCDGSPLSLQMNTINGASYFWSGPNSFTSTLQNPVINPAYPVHAGKYYAWVTVNGCPSPKDSVIVKVNYIPLVGAYASPNDTICEGTVATFVAQYNNGGATPTFQWYKNYVMIPGATTLQYATSNLVTGDRIHCTMHTVGVCTDPTTVSTDTIMMTVLPIVTQPSATISSDPEWPAAGQLTTFTANVQNGGPDPKFQWQLNGTNQNGAIYSKWAAATLRPFDKVNCIITSNDPCAQAKTAYSDTILIGFPTSVVDVNEDGGMNIYPNPNNGKFRITASNIRSQSVKLELLNTIGQVIYKQNLEPRNSSIDQDIEITGLPAGVYLLRLKDGGVQFTERITIQ